MMGTIKLTEETLPAMSIEVDGMVCAEPSSLRLVLGHRGRMEINVNVLCIVPDKCTIIYDRRLVPGETVAGAINQIQEIIDDLSKEDPDFKATVEINSNERSTYTGKSESIESQKEVWIIDREHPFISSCAEALEEVGEEVNFGYWAFSTDIPQLGVRMKKPAVGYSGGQELYVHNEIEKVRLDYFKRVC